MLLRDNLQGISLIERRAVVIAQMVVADKEMLYSCKLFWGGSGGAYRYFGEYLA